MNSLDMPEAIKLKALGLVEESGNFDEVVLQFVQRRTTRGRTLVVAK